MIAALNLLVPFVVIGLILLAMRLKKMFPIYTAIVFVIVYGLFQPSYMPKGKVTTTLPNASFEVTNKNVENRILKPVTAEERDARMKEVEALSEARREELIKQIKIDKEKDNG